MHQRHGASMVKRIARSPLGEAHGQLILISVAGILVGSQAYAGEAGDSGAARFRKCIAMLRSIRALQMVPDRFSIAQADGSPERHLGYNYFSVIRKLGLGRATFVNARIGPGAKIAFAGLKGYRTSPM